MVGKGFFTLCFKTKIYCISYMYQVINLFQIYFLADRRGENCLFPAFVEPAGNSCSAITRTFQILYKNEDVTLNDAFVFTLNMLVDSTKVSFWCCR